jgi:hypothetical protein
MKMQSHRIWSSVGLKVALALMGGFALSARAEEVTGGDLEFFEKRVRPILIERCYECHSVESGKSKGGLLMDSREGLRRGGDSGAALVAGKPEESLLIEAVRYHNQDMQMPPKGAIPASEIAVLEKWVATGAADPRESVAEVGKKKRDFAEDARHWSFARVQPVAVPTGGEAARTPIDAFITSALGEAGLTMQPEADRATLIRRVTFDLTGLPPTAEEVRAFEQDTRVDAYTRLVDRLLESPHYGVRWGRHWLDVARYADSNGLDENVAFGTAWRYRDYVVKSFNEDKPFDVFLTEQLAGDLMPAPDLTTRQQRVAATAFLNLGAKVLAEPDKERLAMDIIDEQIDTVGKSFMGLTLGCARCHEHKFDPISHEDYYALAAIFKSTRSLAATRTGALSHWYEGALGDLDDFARVHASSYQLTEATRKMREAESAASGKVIARAKEQAVDYLIAASELPEHATLTQARAVAEPKGLHGAILLNCRVYLRTAVEETFFQAWREAVTQPGAAQGIRAHYEPLFAEALANAKSEAEGVKAAIAQLNHRQGFLAMPPVLDALYPAETLAEIQALRSKAEQVEKQLPDLPTVMGVAEGDAILETLPVHIRGNHMALGEPVRRGVPAVIKASMGGQEPAFPAKQSGRLELAQWLTAPAHPLTARVFVNRVWTWHFGQGLVRSPDNFGLLGEKPTHPALLDWLAGEFVRSGWKVKDLHRLILNSASYRQASAAQAPESDPENRLLSHFPIRRLEAEEIRDAILSVAGLLDLKLEGKTVPLRNRQFVFNHTSKDATTYESLRRAIYLPIIRNNIYDLFQQFDYPDASMTTGQRSTSVVAPQALWLMNSELMVAAAGRLAVEVAREGDWEATLKAVFLKVFGRDAEARQQARCRDFVREYDAMLASQVPDPEQRHHQVLAAMVQTLLMSNEFLHVR